MKKIELLLEHIYNERICDEYDHVMPVIGDEGVGKSTLIVECMILYQRIKGREVDPDEILESFVYDREGLKERLATAERRSIIAVPDAARVLHKKEAMKGEQVEIEKDFFDVRTKEFLILLGFQDWDSIPSFLQERRAKTALYIPRRGVVRGYNRKSLDERVKKDTWPPSDLTESFPPLVGTELWDRYQELDRQMKDSRMHGAGAEEDEEEMSVDEIIKDIKDRGVQSVVSRHNGNNRPYVNANLIEHDYGLSQNKASKVKDVLERDIDLTQVSQELAKA